MLSSGLVVPLLFQYQFLVEERNALHKNYELTSLELCDRCASVRYMKICIEI